MDEDVARAYGALARLIEDGPSSKATAPSFEGRVEAWKRGECRGAATLALAAIYALRYELARDGLAAGRSDAAEGRVEELRARLAQLARVDEAVVGPKEGGAEPNAQNITEVRLPEDYRRARPGARGFRMGGVQITLERRAEPPRLHLVVHHPERPPTWDEVLRARAVLGESAPELWARAPGPRGTGLAAPGRTVNLYDAPPAAE